MCVVGEGLGGWVHCQFYSYDELLIHKVKENKKILMNKIVCDSKLRLIPKHEYVSYFRDGLPKGAVAKSPPDLTYRISTFIFWGRLLYRYQIEHTTFRPSIIL